ncbi:AfsR/SARP family transcriptional regulator [Streptomyces profundus]|nr:AfsR/SARP family transcriptional regulator [Streptomyces sp. MA3_2.13]
MASQLRQAWIRAGVSEVNEVLRTGRAGYSLTVDLEHIDLYVFRDLVTQAGNTTAAGDLPASVGRLRQALALWRGPVFSGIESQVIQGNAVLIDEERPAAWEECMRLELQLGLHSRVVTELAALVAEFPFREQLVGLLMTAFYRTGQQTAALQTYQQARDRLNDELGIDPGLVLQELHTRILRSDQTLLGSTAHETITLAAPSASADSSSQVPSQIPPSDGSFVGRQDELTTLSEHIGKVQILVVSGAAGMGKTSLVVQWAYQVRDIFPDGQIFIDLRGHSADTSQSARRVLGHMLESFDLPPQEIPGALDKRIALYRSMVADKKVLIVLDNASAIDQVLPAVPTSGGSQLAVTSRNNLAALYAHVAVRGISLDGLSRAESSSILTRAADRPSKESSPELEDLLDLCDGMPLALRILAARMMADRSLTVEALAAGLSDAVPLDSFTLDGDARSVRSVLANTYTTLSEEDARLFRLLAVHPGRRIRVEPVAALAAVPLAGARRGLDSLTALHLLTRADDQYMVMHDLVRSFAAECLDAQALHDRPTEAAERLLEWYLSAAASANAALRPDRDAFADRRVLRGMFAQPFAEDVDAIEFLDQERENLAAVTGLVVRHDIDRAVELLYHLHSYFLRTGFSTADMDAWRKCGENAHRIHDPLLRAHLHHALGGALVETNDLDAAIEHLRLATGLYEAAGQPGGAAGSRLGLGFAFELQGRYHEALTEHERAFDLAKAAQNTTLIVHALNNSADALVALDDLDTGLERLQAGRALARKHGLRHHESAILSSIGALFIRKRDYPKALAHLNEGLALMRQSGFRTAEADTLARMGHAVLGSGDPAGAVEWFRKAKDAYHQSNDASGEADMERLMGGSRPGAR